MRLVPSPAPAYWHSGGAILTTGGPLALRDATRLFSFYCLEALSCEAHGDREGAKYCARSGIELLRAIEAADDHRCAAAGIRRADSPLAEFRARIAEPMPRAA